MPGDSSYLSQHLRQAASLGLLEAKGSGRQDVGLQAISSTLRSVYAWEADVCYPLGHGSWNLATLLLKKDCWKSLYSTQIHGSSGPMLTHAFPTTYPSH